MEQKKNSTKNNKPKNIYLYGDFKLKKDLERYGIKKYTINDDGTIDVDGNVDLSHENLDKIPFKFGKVSGGFYCNNNNLESLEGCPYYVGGDFGCYHNKLKSLVGSPQEVGNSFNCAYNNLITLEGMPLEIGDNFNCRKNYLKELDSISNIEGTIYCDMETDISKFLGFCKDIKRSMYAGSA